MVSICVPHTWTDTPTHVAQTSAMFAQGEPRKGEKQNKSEHSEITNIHFILL